MSTLKIKLKGNDHLPYLTGEDQGFEFYGLDQAFTVFNPTRGDVEEQTIVIDDDKIIEFEFDDNSVWIGDRETLGEIFPGQFKRSAGEDELFLPDEISSEDSERGIFKKVGIKLLKVFVKKKVIRPKMREMAGNLENKQLAFKGNDFKKVKYGILCHCLPDFELEEAKDLDISKPHILFLHGTGSSTKSSFGDLKESSDWKDLVSSYGEKQILAFQHRSLTCSPLENVMELVSQLPDGIELDLLSQSRGGLVADVLARFCTSEKGFDDAERGVLIDNDRDRDIEVIEELKKLMTSKKIKIRKMVRVASPANGTTLASKRLNIFLNVTFNLVGLATGQAGNPIFVAFKETIMEAVSCKDDVDVLPGLEAMNPKSPFIKILNYQGSDIVIDIPLFVVGGSSELSLRFKSLVVLVGKFFFLDKNDLVVDTESMKWGGVRKRGIVNYFIEKSGQIDHFKYFSTSRTLKAVIDALEIEIGLVPDGFLPQERSGVLERGALGLEGGDYKREKISGDRPIAIVLPGIMGSNLRDDKMLWINYFRFLKGDLKNLAYQGGAKEKLKADSLIATSYEDLGKNLEKTYDVLTFQFDWRLPLKESAKILNEKISELLKLNQPIKIVAHSMGGVLVRDFILYHPETWQKLNTSIGFRAVFLGSPLGGSYRIPYVLFGKDSIIRLLGKIDIRHSTKDLLNVFCDFPGILNLLPMGKNIRHDFSDRSFWERMRAAFGDESWPIPSKKILEEFKQHQEVFLNNSDSIDYSNICYIAGQSSKKNFTVSNLEIEDGELVFYGTNAGDESVTWESGIPEPIKKSGQYYYCNVTHGGLSKDSKLFAAIEDLLIYGSTNKLQNSLPNVRGEEHDFVAAETEIFDISEENVLNTIIGVDKGEEKWIVETPIRIGVSHGDLKYAKYPVLAGHFEFDAILTTEKAIDNQLNGELSRLHSLGLYPGKIGTNQIVLSDKKSRKAFKGGVIVGLGLPGELSAYQLMISIEKGVSRYLTIRNLPVQDSGSSQEYETLGISVIAIANTYGGLSTDSSIRAIISGIQRANRNIRATYKGTIRGIEEIEVIELFNDKALSILKSVHRLQSNESREFNIVFEGIGLKNKVGRRWRIPYDNSNDWWTRITVCENVTDDSEKFKMSMATTGASEKVEEIESNNKTLDILLKDMTVNNQYSPEIAKTMFELLIPLNFKEELKRQNNISWVVDLPSAEYPWEMIQEDINSLPLCIHSGMVRQLSTQNSREKIARVKENTALVIGDPLLGGFLSQLPGAKKEAEIVKGLLKQQGYEVESLINSTASSIFLKLFSKNHKIIHLAGHGLFEYGPKKSTGMVIGKESFLSPGQLAGMSETAELVFVNCCYLGQMNSESEAESQQKNKFAANIGTQLINNGARAVIVAGWAVDDAAAQEFAKEFYTHMFDGYGFGESVKRARKKIFEEFGRRTNTWGAFQCYGDPFYTLSEGGGSYSSDLGFLVIEEVEIELQNLLQRMEANDYDPDYTLKRILDLEASVEKMGVQNDKILELSSAIYNGLNEYGRALGCFEKLLKSEKSKYSVKALEQYCNVRSKFVAKEFLEGNVSSKEAIKSIDSVINDLNLLNLLHENTERLSLLASAYKRRMLIFANSDKKDQLIESLDLAVANYEKASVVSGFRNPYPLTNWLSLLKLKLMFSGDNGLKKIPISARKALDEIVERGEFNQKNESDFWDLATLATIALTKYLIGISKMDIAEVKGTFDSVWEAAGHKGQKIAEIENLQILSILLEKIDSDASKQLNNSLIDMIKSLESKI
ncbi:tetratricopeptide (TPR) repeat protein [Algoriphagus iocasae]|uniref:Tetratricopeptide (TPR) repeat protein n=1 Tax=Algoriphagus iocasae TaxID=1836499 RepID=A0A841MPZ3_9BACT|nr:CHAT domain-containing protein [Algoriphagus iocasae]MBB6327587.1 tetratricopeptide (TPR) repeat protein [Algoriphagus iocasae]